MDEISRYTRHLLFKRKSSCILAISFKGSYFHKCYLKVIYSIIRLFLKGLGCQALITKCPSYQEHTCMYVCTYKF